MKHLTLIIAFVISSFLVNAQGWMWAKHFNGTGQNIPCGIIQDGSGNYYVYGSFTGTVTQDTITLNSSGLYDVFISKYNKNGQIVWIKQISGTATESAVSIVLSNDGNYFYISGTTNGTASFDGNNIISSGGLDVYLAKYDLDGTLQWVHNTAYGTGNQGNGNFSIDASGNIVQLGAFTTAVTFYGGVTSLNDASGIRQNYIAKYDGDGNILWAKKIQDDNAATFAKTVTACSDGYFISGNYKGNLFFDIDTITSTGLNDAFLYKSDLNGNGLFVRKIEGNNDDYIWKHKSDANDNQYLTGYYKSTRLKVDSTGTDTSLLTLNNVSSGTNDLFLAKYNASGTLQWVRTVGSSSNDYSYNIEESNGKILITGCYGGAISFDAFPLTFAGGTDVFIAECNSSGQFTGAYKAAGTQNDAGKACIYNSTGKNFVAAGEFYSDTLKFGTDTFPNSVQDFTTRDAFVAKYGCFDSLNMSSTPVSCYGGNDGTASATPTDGSAPYTYLWSNDSTTSTIIGLSSGTYTVTVTGANNCTVIDSITIAQPNALNSSPSQTNVSCSGLCDGTASANPSGGTAPYTYLWSTIPAQTNSTATNLCIGIYSVTVSDINNCTTTSSVTITNPAVLSAITSQNNGCNGICNKSATVIPSGGTIPYTYLWSNAQTTATATDLCAGEYSVTITDACNSTTTQYVTITEPPVLDATTSQTYPTSGCNGTAVVSPTGGTNPYNYIWSTIPSQTNDTATNLCADLYSVTVTDNNGCTLLKAFNLVPPTKLRDDFCGYNTSDKTTIIYCDQIAGAQDYEFVFTDTSIGFTGSKTTEAAFPGYGFRNYIRINYISGILYGYTYDVKVRAKVNGVWGDYGTICPLTLSVGTTSLQVNYCGFTTSDKTTIIYCDPVTSVEDYEFVFTNATLGFNEFTQTSIAYGSTYGFRNYIRINYIPGILYGYTYDVKVRAKVNGVWGNYGNICQVTLAVDTTKLKDPYCGFTTPSTSTIIYCDQVTSVQDYEFVFTNAGLGFNGSKKTSVAFGPAYGFRNYIRINYIAGILPGYTYDVTVRAKVNGVWGNFSTMCQITISTGGKYYSETELSELISDNNIIAFPNPFNNGFSIQWENPVHGIAELEIYDITGKKISQSFFDVTDEEVFGQELIPGLYFVQIKDSNGLTNVIKMIKTD